jgi:hypothetical protein
MPTCNLRVLISVGVKVTWTHPPIQRKIGDVIKKYDIIHSHVEPNTHPCGAHNITQLLGYIPWDPILDEHNSP